MGKAGVRRPKVEVWNEGEEGWWAVRRVKLKNLGLAAEQPHPVGFQRKF